MSDKKQTAVEWFKDVSYPYLDKESKEYVDILFNHALQMEREQIDKFNDFLEKEKQFKISDLKTVERIQWYYNTYFNETFGGQDDN
jgi:hypothetical protein